jgi:hypothetical protein
LLSFFLVGGRKREDVPEPSQGLKPCEGSGTSSLFQCFQRADPKQKAMAARNHGFGESGRRPGLNKKATVQQLRPWPGESGGVQTVTCRQTHYAKAQIRH